MEGEDGELLLVRARRPPEGEEGVEEEVVEVLVATARPTWGEGEGGVLALETEGCCCSEEPAALDVAAAGGESGGDGAAAAN